MTAKSQSRLRPNLLRNGQYSGTISTILYNWPLFSGALFFGLITIAAGTFVYTPWNRLLLLIGVVTFLMVLNIWIASFIIYDWGQQREYERLATLGNLSKANVVIDITAGKLRGTRGMLARFQQGHYFVIDIFDPQKMPDLALKRARELEPPLEAGRRIYRREGKASNLPIPHNWADVVYCSFSLHELQNSTDRQAIFNEFARILKPNGKLLIAEHGRDWPNFLVFGLGALSFVAPKTWIKHINKAGLDITYHERWRGLVHLWVAERKPRS